MDLLFLSVNLSQLDGHDDREGLLPLQQLQPLALMRAQTLFLPGFANLLPFHTSFRCVCESQESLGD